MSQQSKHLYEFGPFQLSVPERLLLRDGKVVPLTPKTLDLLLVLVEGHGRLLEKDELMKRVWPDTFVEEANLSYNISLIRKALGDGETGMKFIETVPKRGYRFIAEVKTIPAILDVSAQAELTGSETPARGASKVPTQIKRRRLPIILLVFGLIVGAMVWLVAFRSLRTLPPIKITPFTSLPGDKAQPSFSPDGNQLAFSWEGEEGGYFHVYVKQIGNETLRKLTGHSAAGSAEISPVWSPDSRFIAFIKKTEEGYGVSVIPSLGGVERKITEPIFAQSGSLDWSPDGEWIVVDGNRPDNETYSLYLVLLKTGEVRKLTSPPNGSFGDRSPKFSPDGKTLVFKRGSGIDPADIYLISVAGGEPKRLTFDNAPTFQTLWMADGKEILFLSNRGDTGRTYLWRMPAIGGEPVRVEIAPQRIGIGNVAISKQGDRLALVEWFDNSNIWQLELGKTPGLPPKQVPYSTRVDHSPQLSPDGKKIAFASNRSGSLEIWVCDSDGLNLVQLTFTGRNGSPRWSPDSRYIVYDSVTDGTDIYVIKAEGGSPRRLTMESSEDIVPSWSGDGQWIYFSSNRTGKLQIWKMPAAGGVAVQVTKQGGFDSMESPDGQYLYYLKARAAPGIWRIPVAGGQEAQVFEHPSAGNRRYWTVIEQGIYFATADQPAHPLIEFFNFATGNINTVAKLDKPIYQNMPGLSASPNGRKLIWSQLDRSGCDIVLIENFR